jgi:hypothetical protein
LKSRLEDEFEMSDLGECCTIALAWSLRETVRIAP